MATWKEMIGEEMKKHGESWADVVHNTLTGSQLNKGFYDGYGSSEGKPFTMWTNNRVYFPAVYDGAEWCASVPRNPCTEKTEHVGGQ